jgi:hypothetical protein
MTESEANQQHSLDAFLTDTQAQILTAAASTRMALRRRPRACPPRSGKWSARRCSRLA